MLPKKQIIGTRIIRIVSLLKKDLTGEFSIREISQKANLSYDNCYRTIFDLSGRGIIEIKRKGKINYCSLRKSPETTLLLAYTSFLETEEFLKGKIILKKILHEFEERVKSEIQALALFGSYAKGRERKGSDIDLLCLAEPDKKPEIAKEARFIGMKYDKRVQAIVADSQSFKEMILAKNITVGKEVLNSGKVLFGFEHYWSTVMETLK